MPPGQVFSDMYLKQFFRAYPELHETVGPSVKCVSQEYVGVISSGKDTTELLQKHDVLVNAIRQNNLMKKLEEFDLQTPLPIFKAMRSYMDSALTLLLFILATREGLWNLHLAALEKLCALFFSRDRLKYAQMVPSYIAQMHSLRESDPEIWHEFSQGNFCVNKSDVPFCSIGVDHAIEHINRMMKVKGGLSGITQKPATLTQFFLVAPELTHLVEEIDYLGSLKAPKRTKHHELTPSRCSRQYLDVEKLHNVMSDCDPFCQEEDVLKNIVTQAVMPDDVTKDILHADEVGQQCYEKFVEQHVKGPTNIWEKMSKIKLLTWKSASKTCTLKLPSYVIELKNDRSLFA